VNHRHAGGAGGSVFWEIRLAPPGSRPPSAADARRVFESEPLRGIPGAPEAAFLKVSLPPRDGEKRPASFLSWFLVDPAKQFAPRASFETR
jgi:hypothetical protein